jgi:glutaminase
MAPTPTVDPAALRSIVDAVATEMSAITERGVPASYIPELASGDVSRFGLAVAPVHGAPALTGEAEAPFSVQSVSKVFMLTLALERSGEAVWRRVGREPSGDPFNSIVQLEYEHGVPRNPFINAGALVIADILMADRGAEAAILDILRFVRRIAGDDEIGCDARVAASEMRTVHRNRALASFMAAEGNLRHDVEAVLSVYVHACAIAMSCRQLATAARYLAAAGQAGAAGSVVTPDRARRLNALMLTCGHYDASGEFAHRVGIPAKSGVGGGIVGVVPGVASIAAWCPGLDAKGNSVIAARAFEALARRTGWSVFGPLAPVPG